MALYWSRQVCIRALPADNVEYLVDTAVGKTASLAGAVGAGFAAVFVVVRGAGAEAVVGAGAAGAAAVSGAAVEAGVAAI